ncbi:MAG: OmpA family protein [Bacteroidota bacterium]|nr:OmpA family protein [Bacteroidota bacterium]
MSKIHRTITVLIILIVSSLYANAQEYSVNSKRAIKYFEKALSDYRISDFESAESSALEALSKEPKFSEAYLLLSDIYESTGEYMKQSGVLKKAVELVPGKKKMIMLKLIETELKTGKYKEAERYIKQLDKESLPAFYRDNLDTFKEAVNFALHAIENPVEFDPVNCGPIVNSKHDDYFPALTADGRKLYKTVSLPTGKYDAFGNEFFQEDLFVTTRQPDGTPIKTQAVPGKINTAGNEGAFTVSPDGKQLFFTVCSHSHAGSYHGAVVGSCDIFVADYMSGNTINISNPKEPLNSPAWESQPSFSSDGKTLFFASSRKGGNGKDDLWVSHKKDDGLWSKPKNLGDLINTDGSENSPFIHPDNKTLYFSSDGHPGMGGYDIFVSRKDKFGEWSKPKNIGYPVNTHKNETGLIVDVLGDSAYFASVREDTRGGQDIYRFAVAPEISPERTSYITGRVYNRRNNAPIQAEIRLNNTDNGKLRATTQSDKSGDYLLCINSGNNYAFNVSEPGFMFYSEQFLLKELSVEKSKFVKNIPLSPIKSGKSVILKNIYFASDSYQLSKASEPELEQLVKFLRLNPTVVAEISGHTDDRGGDSYNLNLSRNRAQAVYNHLLAKGVKKEALKYEGYGSSKPIVKNTSPKNRQLNRRTEFKIIKQ